MALRPGDGIKTGERPVCARCLGWEKAAVRTQLVAAHDASGARRRPKSYNLADFGRLSQCTKAAPGPRRQASRARRGAKPAARARAARAHSHHGNRGIPI
ncbi:hypothetical protein BURMUCF2_1716 [Burkholderia multivorans CF2]|nr:hypothetical protein BURMUCF2_1716 [Burkholderia multivorans CF2]